MLRAHIFWVLSLGVVVSLIWFFAPFIITWLFEPGLLTPADTLKELGSIGDSYGVLNSLFTGLALSAIVVAIFIQSAQLKSQKENLEIYRREVERTLDHIEKDDRWNRVRSKMDVLPLLSNLAEEGLRDILGPQQVATNFYKSPAQIERLRNFIISEIRTYELNIKMSRENLDKVKQEILKLESMSSEEMERLLEEMKVNRSFPVFSGDRVKEAETKVSNLEGKLCKLKVAQELLEEIVSYQSDLRRAYSEARETAS